MDVPLKHFDHKVAARVDLGIGHGSTVRGYQALQGDLHPQDILGGDGKAFDETVYAFRSLLVILLVDMAAS